MPITDKSAYPDNWNEIAATIKARAGYICQDCGMQCRMPSEPFDTHKRTMSVHHIDHIPAHCEDDNLIALCARCHLIRDAPHHAQNAAHTRRRKRIAGGQMELEL